LGGTESTPLVSTLALQQGNNPYSLSNYLDKMYVYGGLYPLLMAPLIDVIQPPIRIPRLISAISVLLSSLLMFWILWKRNSSIVGLLVATVILAYILCLILKITLAEPDLPGFLLFLFGLFIFTELESLF
jgi:hypothetical protein